MLINGRYDSYDDLENYAEFAHSSISYLLLELLGLKDDMELQYAASHFGVSNGLISLLRSYPYHASMVSAVVFSAKFLFVLTCYRLCCVYRDYVISPLH